MPGQKINAHFIEPMLLHRADKLPEGGLWVYELKLDGFRAEAIKSDGRVHLRSRNDKDFNTQFPAIVRGRGAMPDETVIDGEVVAVDESGRPSFSALQNNDTARLLYYVFDVMVLDGRDVTNEPLTVRREVLRDRVLAKLAEPIRESPLFESGLTELVCAVKAQGLEGLVQPGRPRVHLRPCKTGTEQEIKGRLMRASVHIPGNLRTKGTGRISSRNRAYQGLITPGSAAC